ncbi:MAG: nitroreductase family protein [Tissierellales bacterium]|nr:nitroreductase family protein [Tissierellales bacterium]
MDFKELAENRRSVKYFDKDKDVDLDTIKKIINLATYSPSAFNLQPWSIIAVRSEEAKKRLYKLADEQSKILKASTTLIMIGDRTGFEEYNPVWKRVEDKLGSEKKEIILKANRKLYGETEEKRIKFGELNTGLLAMSIMYSASYYGVDSHPVGGIDAKGIKEEFNIEGNKHVVMLICLGHFNEEKTMKPRKHRKKFEDFVEIV